MDGGIYKAATNSIDKEHTFRAYVALVGAKIESASVQIPPLGQFVKSFDRFESVGSTIQNFISIHFGWYGAHYINDDACMISLKAVPTRYFRNA